MNIEEVPQDASDFKARNGVRKLVYATDPNGAYTGVVSSGWDAEHAAMKGAWEEADEVLAETAEMVRSGKLSPIAYFMQKTLMDAPLLAKYVGCWTWQVKRHCKPSVFNRLRPEMLQRYAAVFEIPVSALTNFDQEQRGGDNH